MRLIALLLLMFLTSPLARAEAEFSLLIFLDDQPAHNLAITTLGKGGEVKAVTDRDGQVVLDLPAGQYKVTVRNGDKPLSEFSVRLSDEKSVAATVSYYSKGKDPELEVQAEAGSGLKLSSDLGSSRLGKVQGQVISAESGQGVAGARVFVKGHESSAVTNSDGKFQISVPEGENSLVVIHPKYSTQSVPRISSVAGKIVKRQVELTPAAVQIDDFVVLAPHIAGSVASLLETRRKSGNVADVIGSEQFSRSGDSSAASALKRVTGITLVDGKYIYVRGLGERYSSALLNGSAVPSPDPARRVVPLDLFPSAMLDSMVVQKSYSPDMPGEFGGGTIQMKTKGVPSEFIAKISLSAGPEGGDGESEKAISHRGYASDYKGKDDGRRRIPKQVEDAIRSGREFRENNIFFKNGFEAEQLEALGESFSKDYAVKEEEITPNYGVAISLGNRHRIKKAKLGYFAALNYKNKWDIQSKRSRDLNLGFQNAQEVSKDLEHKSSANNIKFGGVGVLGAEWGKNHKVTSVSLLTRDTDKLTKISEGYYSETDGTVRFTRLEWLERELSVQQFTGEHKIQELGKVKVDWRYNRSIANRVKPDTREYRYDLEEGDWVFSTRGDGNRRSYDRLQDRVVDWGGDLTVPILDKKKFSMKIKVGYNEIKRERESDVTRFKFEDKRFGNTDPNLTRRGIEGILDDENIGPGGFQVASATLNSDNYFANQTILARYALIDLGFFEDWRFLMGVRYEDSRQSLETVPLFEDDPVKTQLEMDNRLPVYTLTWKFTEKMQLRGSYSQTLSRPDFKELSPAEWYNDDTEHFVRGNPDLQGTTIKNYDLRWEWYPVSNESVSLGFFQKDFSQPIESTTEPGNFQSYENSESAYSQGVEVDFRKNLAFINTYLSDLTFSGNVSFIESQVTRNPGSTNQQTTDKRALQGQSPYVYNANLEYEHQGSGTIATLVYNVYGRRIAEVGLNGEQDIYEEPVQNLGFVLSQKLNKNASMKFQAKNLLDSEVINTQGSEKVQTYKKGLEFSVGLSMTL